MRYRYDFYSFFFVEKNYPLVIHQNDEIGSMRLRTSLVPLGDGSIVLNYTPPELITRDGTLLREKHNAPSKTVCIINFLFLVNQRIVSRARA